MDTQNELIKGLRQPGDNESDAEAGRKARAGDPERRAAILACAEAIFLEEGYERASMSAIAARVGGSKGTLYNYFASKEELFLACVRRHCDAIQRQMAALDASDGDLRAALTKLGRGYVEVVTSDDVIRKFRMIAAEADRSPQLARALYEMGPAEGEKLLARYLAHAMREGLLNDGDPHLAASHFLGLCMTRLWKQRIYNVLPAPSAERIRADVEDAVRVFLAAYGRA